MISVYLDQAKWIDLGRAMHGRSDGEQYQPALDVARHSVEMGFVAFPLSMGHYIETWRAGDPRRRKRLAETMIELSGGRTIARPPDLCNNELDALLARMAERRAPARRPWPVFGFGFGHAAGVAQLTPGEIDLDIERANLAQRPDGFLGYGRGHREFGDMYRAGEEGLAAGASDRGETKDTREAVLAVSAVMEIYENIEWALDGAGLDRDALGPLGHVRPDLEPDRVHEVLNEALPLARGFIAELPTRDAVLRLRLLRHENPGTKWEANDLNDIAYLADAVVHCDVVVTERQWVHELTRSGLLEDHGTAVLHDVAELPEALVTTVQ